jgi:hypothetical protein
MDRRAVSELRDVNDLADRELDAALVALDRDRRRIDGELARVIARAEETGQFAADGHATVTAWAEATCNWSPAEARAYTRLARLGQELPATLEALGRGDVGVAQAAALARLHANPRVRCHLADSETLLVDQAGRLPFVDFRIVCDRWLQLADEDGAHRRHDRAHEERNAHASIVGSRFRLDAAGDVVSGAAMSEILERFCDAEFHADWDSARDRFGDATCAAVLERTAGQRRFDALKAIFFTAATAGASPASVEPLVNLTIDDDTFCRHVDQMFGRPFVSADPATVLDRRCETTSGHLVDPQQAVAAALVGQVRRVVTDSSGRVLDLGRRRRLFTGAVREAVQLTERRCAWPGCHVPVRQSQVDHTIAYAARGSTGAQNGGILCGRHNRYKTRGYRTWRDPTGTWHTYRPDHTEIAPRPP